MSNNAVDRGFVSLLGSSMGDHGPQLTPEVIAQITNPVVVPEPFEASDLSDIEGRMIREQRDAEKESWPHEHQKNLKAKKRAKSQISKASRKKNRG